LKFILSKEKGCQKVEEKIGYAFCTGTLASKNESKCREIFLKIKN
jgi:hypothetical protein